MTVPLTLDHVPDHQACRITAIHPPAAAPEWADWLHDLGFIPGERVVRMARALGGDPLVVRVGTSTFALRTAEAACVEVSLLTEASPA